MRIGKLLLIGTAIVLGFSFLNGAHTVRQIVDSWPTTHDTTGVSWIIYAVSDPAQYNSTNDPVNTYIVYPGMPSPRIRWYTDIDNWDWVWSGGDEMISFGSWDSAYAANPGTYGNNPNHTGFYWVYNDTVDRNQAPQDWATDPSGLWDTLRVMPSPIAEFNGANDTVIVKIPNPRETGGNPDTADIMGFWVFADTTNPTPLGTPNTYTMEVGYFARATVGDTTYCRDLASNYPAGRSLMFAYRMVARPETSVVDTPPGFTSQFFSPNSNLLSPMSIEEAGLSAVSVSHGIWLQWFVASHLAYRNAEVVRDGALLTETNKTEYLDTSVKPHRTYKYEVYLHFLNGEIRHLGPIEVLFQGSSGTFLTFSPNPFKDEGIIDLLLPSKQNIAVKIFDVAGKAVETLHTGELNPGHHRFQYAPRGVGSGIYYIVVCVGSERIASKKVLRMR